MEKAKVFWNGHSQAVQLPNAYRFAESELRIRREGSAIILEPIADDWVWLDHLVGDVDEDFRQAVSEEPEPEDRVSVSFFE